MANEKKSTAKKVLPVDNVEVKWLEGSKHHKAGDTSMLHTVQAAKMVEKGVAEIVKGGKTEKKTADFEKDDKL